MRLIELVHRTPEGVPAAPDLLADLPVADVWRVPVAGDREAVRILVHRRDSEEVVDRLRERLAGREYRVVVLPVEAVMPPLAPRPPRAGEERRLFGRRRLSRQELWNDIQSAAELTPVFLLLSALSAGVACVGLVRNDVVIIIAAMVIAPLLGPNVALALATTLGSAQLAARAIRTGLAGLAVALVLSFALGLLLTIEPALPAIAARARVDLPDVALALASGAAAALAFTTGAPGTLIGVMVAVALVPPLVTCGLLLGAGYERGAARAALLVATNLACVNLAGTVTFVAQGVRPWSWWNVERARRGWRAAILAWALLLVALVALIYLGGTV